jgi:A/G-specific adenine glycosylase
MAWPLSERLLAPLAPWFDANRRDLPWRAADLDAPHPDPYAVLVSELMLQQTQVATVVPYFERWMARWPDARALASATEEEVHKAWEGLGYYRRARLLHAAAKAVAGNGWPEELEGLKALPGLGDYTAAALAAQAFQRPEPALDGNVFRVAARLLGLEEDPRPRARELREWLRPALAAHGPSRMVQALMELGATVCAPLPRCGACPIANGCQARRLGATDRIPPAVKRAAPRESAFTLVAVEAGGRWLVGEPRGRGLLAGLWRWPSVSPTSQEDMVDQAAEAAGTYTAVEVRAFAGWTQVYTHRRERVQPLHLRLGTPFPAPAGCHWVDAARLAALPMGGRDSRLRDLLGSGAGAQPLDQDVQALLGVLRGGGGPGG